MTGPDLGAAEARFLELAVAGGVSARRERVLQIDVDVRAAGALRRLEDRGHRSPSVDDVVADMMREFGCEVEL